ncbi:type II secretion system protein [Pseudoxanthomonas sp.]|uniref:prepilin-type N-terminal cleavage/methylation domain-containing protein n=1 Tax=Pseudoxanthomonas sp. TaxID=1871049 RepID=UPI0025859728|nr:type II secretion system protein [Pseudoxanthomonas sp.]MCR6685640.1 type II secretion system GspH family protein [Pseudoxanthomonas sp.]
MRRDTPSIRRTQGFSLLEVAVVIGVLGLLTMAMTSAFENVQQVRGRKAAIADAEGARNAVRAFALRNKRLPCPDNSTYGDTGREAGSGSCPAGVDIGWLPYESLGLAVPVRASRLRYGVNRGVAGLDPTDPTPTAADGLDLEGTGGFSAALGALAASPAGTGAPYYVVQSATDPAVTCAGGDLINPAFVLVAPGQDQEVVDGEPHPGFDTPNRGFATAGSKCVAAPGRPADASYDDVVVTEGVHALLGWLKASTR